MTVAAEGSLLARVAEAHRSDLWADATTVEATLDAGGLLLRWKRGRAGRLRNLHVVADINVQRIRLVEFHHGRDAFLDGHAVWLADADNRPQVRRDARSRFPYGPRMVHWDVLDMTYFLGYALWNYLTFAALLTRPDVTWTQTDALELTAHFPPDLATHCRAQLFRVDPATFLVAEHLYTSEVFGRSWAHACHLTDQYREADGVPYASRRRVRPSRPDRSGPMSQPLLIWADIHGVTLRKDTTTAETRPVSVDVPNPPGRRLP